MNDRILRITDYWIKPQKWYSYTDPCIDGYCMIVTKAEQRQAGYIQNEPLRAERVRGFGASPIKPYRDYYGTFRLSTGLVAEELKVKFAIGYTINSPIITADDVSNFSWLRLCTGLEEVRYPNLAHQKQLLEYLLTHSKRPRFLITRVYQYLQSELYQSLTEKILSTESGNVSGKPFQPEG